jgi:hypothetical protein
MPGGEKDRVESPADQRHYFLEDAAAREILLCEYRALRDEICKKMDHRTTMTVSSITVSLVALGVGIERKSGVLLLLIPMVCVLFGLFVVFNNKSIADISEYIKRNIESGFGRVHPAMPAWHTSLKHPAAHMKEIFTIYHLPNMLVVLAPSLASLAIAWAQEAPPTTLLPLTLLDALLLIAYILQYVRIALSARLLGAASTSRC